MWMRKMKTTVILIQMPNSFTVIMRAFGTGYGQRL
ncbi:unnamed protein product [Acanthoscelides obtectus]|uniref:Uncharacterized protein n=1 Tax=Acanthoscelides obtectus TaxID=200917 RepID=A0A9P0KU31_ACAOB|nr:unnamed protein product [Acanthoscelides obtectus]CAK1628602.1 hypothetical protein AOBTE_LOCUS5299 [Acanthoscelides obtectus]